MLAKHTFEFLLCFLYIYIFVHVNAQNFGQGEGNACSTNSGKPGICRLFDNCLNIELLYAEGGQPKVCGWTNGDAIVCCPQTGAPLSKSEQKCEEYSRIRCFEDTDETVHTILGGEEVESVLEYPHQVHIGYGNHENPQYLCGGTLISEQWVMTAAHCLTTRSGSPSVISLGFLDTKNRTEYGTYQKRKVVESIKHPERQNTKYHDIALLKLDQPVQMSKYAVPACLHNTTNIPTTQAIATGWGNTAFGNRAQSDKLMKVKLKILNYTACYKLYMNNRDRKLPDGIKDESQFCAGEIKKDTCQGDSGGPLQILHSNLCMHRIIGITSFGINCGIREGVYTRVSHYLPWIENIVWP